MAEDDFTVSVTQNVDTDLAVGRPWQTGIRQLIAAASISAVTTGTADAVTLYIGRESFPILIKQGATTDTDTDILDNNKLKPLGFVNVDAAGVVEGIRCVARHADSAAKNHRVRMIYN